MIYLKVPLRIGLFGGGTDLEKFYKSEPGSVSNITIDKYIYINAKVLNPTFEEKFRLNYSETERVKNIRLIKNKIIKNTLLFHKIKLPLYISSISDVPAGTGLGSSSSFCVGLNLAINKILNNKINKYELAENACYIEIKMGKSNIGKQDQYAATFQGFNNFTFNKDKVTVSSLTNKIEIINDIFDRSLLFWTGINRDSDLILKKQIDKDNWKKSKIRLQELKQTNHYFLNLLNKFKINEFYELLNYSFSIKEEIIKSNKKILKIKRELFDNNAKALKLLGAGEGGFFWTIFGTKKQMNNFFDKNKNNCLKINSSE